MNITEPQLRTTGRMVRNGSDSTPTVHDDGGALAVGTELLREDTGGLSYWDGSTWKAVTTDQKLCQLVEFLREIRDQLNKE